MPLVVGMRVLVSELLDLVLVEVEMLLGCDVGVGTKELMGVKDGEGGV